MLRKQIDVWRKRNVWQSFLLLLIRSTAAIYLDTMNRIDSLFSFCNLWYYFSPETFRHFVYILFLYLMLIWLAHRDKTFITKYFRTVVSGEWISKLSWIYYMKADMPDPAFVYIPCKFICTIYGHIQDSLCNNCTVKRIKSSVTVYIKKT